MSEVVLLLPNTDSLQQVENYVRGGTTSTKYWQPSTSWRLCQRWYYFYQIVTAFNKLKIMSEVVLLLPNTDSLQQVEDYVRGGTTSTKYWQPSTSWRLCRRWYYFYQILTAFNKLKIMSEFVQLLLLPNTDRLQQQDYVKSCTWQLKLSITYAVLCYCSNNGISYRVLNNTGSIRDSCLFSRGYGSLIYNYLYNQSLSPLKLWVPMPLNTRCTLQHYAIKFVSDLRQVFSWYSSFLHQ
jgi:hypothetical protein